MIGVGHSSDCEDGHYDHDEFFYSGDDDEKYDSYDNLLRMLFNLMIHLVFLMICDNAEVTICHNDKRR